MPKQGTPKEFLENFLPVGGGISQRTRITGLMPEHPIILAGIACFRLDH
jgi:hypothetical protein